MPSRSVKIIESLNKSISILDYPVDREGAYGILINDNNEYGLILLPGNKLALLGGGIDPGEAQVAALCREVAEEVGASCSVTSRRLGVSVEELWSPKAGKVIISRQYYYNIELGDNDQIKVEDDHELVWLSDRDASSYKWLYQSQKSACLYNKFGYFD